ncbi:hypothetical protein G9A89_000513, partial [Geosiphon pyriformis]
ETGPATVQCQASSTDESDETTVSHASFIKLDSSDNNSAVMSGNMQKQQDEMEAKLDSKNTEILQLQQKIEDLGKTLTAKNNELSISNSKLEHLQKDSDLQMSKLLELNTSLTEKLASKEKDYELITGNHLVQIQCLESEKEVSMIKVGHQESVLANLREQIQHLDTCSEHFKSVADQHSEYAKNYKKEVEQHLAIIRQKDGEINELILQRHRLEIELQTLEH